MSEEEIKSFLQKYVNEGELDQNTADQIWERIKSILFIDQSTSGG